MPIADLIRTNSSVSWTFPKRHISVAIIKKADYLDITITSEGEERFTWPKVQAGSYMLPMWEGKYIPANDTWWKEFLKGQSFNFLEDFSMEFFAINKPSYSIVYVAKNRFNDEVKFNTDSIIKFSFIHDFTTIAKNKSYGFRMYITDNTPVAVSAVYKRYIQENGWFKTLEEKAIDNPNIRKLYGAPHIYFWTHGVITEGNIRWKNFQMALKTNGKLMNWLIEVLESYYDKDTGTEFNNIYQECLNQNQISGYQKKIITNALNKAITLKELYNPAVFNYPITVAPRSLSEQKLYMFNKLLLKSALKDVIDTPWSGAKEMSHY